VPIVEPEVTLGPGDYTIEETAFWSERVYSHVFRLLNEYNVMLARAPASPRVIFPQIKCMMLPGRLNTLSHPPACATACAWLLLGGHAEGCAPGSLHAQGLRPAASAHRRRACARRRGAAGPAPAAERCWRGPRRTASC
jgi:hypothetical protein